MPKTHKWMSIGQLNKRMESNFDKLMGLWHNDLSICVNMSWMWHIWIYPQISNGLETSGKKSKKIIII